LWEFRHKNWKNAQKHFEKALKADERHARAAANWAALELQLGNPKRAEEIARRALNFEPDNVRLRHALAASLLAQNVISDEMIEGFAAAGAETPKTFLAAAQLEFKRGNWRKAKSYAKAYLDTGDKEFIVNAQEFIRLPDSPR